MGLLILIIVLLLCAALYPQQKLEKPWWMDQNEWNHEQEQERRRRRKRIIKVVLIAMVLTLLWLVWKTCVYPTRPLPFRYEPRTMQSNISDEFAPFLQLRTISARHIADLVVIAEVCGHAGRFAS
jgi:di/tricarboxylate transporter